MMSDTSTMAPAPSVQDEYYFYYKQLENARMSLNSLYPNTVEESVEIDMIRQDILQHEKELLDKNAIVNATLSDVNRVSDMTTHLLQRASATVGRLMKHPEDNTVNDGTTYR